MKSMLKPSCSIAAEHGIDVLTEASADYPRPLRQIHDPPGVLFRRGQAAAAG